MKLREEEVSGRDRAAEARAALPCDVTNTGSTRRPTILVAWLRANPNLEVKRALDAFLPAAERLIASVEAPVDPA